MVKIYWVRNLSEENTSTYNDNFFKNKCNVFKLTFFYEIIGFHFATNNCHNSKRSNFSRSEETSFQINLPKESFISTTKRNLNSL